MFIQHFFDAHSVFVANLQLHLLENMMKKLSKAEVENIKKRELSKIGDYMKVVLEICQFLPFLL